MIDKRVWLQWLMTNARTYLKMGFLLALVLVLTLSFLAVEVIAASSGM